MTDSEVAAILDKLETLTRQVDRIYQGLYGIPDTEDNGICGDLKALKQDYYEFKRRVLIVSSFAAGSGALGFGIAKAIGG